MAKPNDSLLSPAPWTIPTLDDGAEITVSTISAIYGLAEACDPVTPGHKPFAVEIMSGPRFRVRADELRKVFGTRRRPNAPLPIGGFRPPRNSTK